MKIVVAGASGAIGRFLVPLLVEAGHEVIGITRTANKTSDISQAGATPLVVDVLQRYAVISALEKIRPEVIVHQLTAIPARMNVRKFDQQFSLTNRLRREGTDNLIAAAYASGCRRLVAQSYAAWPYARVGGAIKTENDPLDTDPPAAMQKTLAAIRYLESAVLRAEGIRGTVLRYGAFYGSGTSIGEGGSVLEDLRRRRFPLVNGANGIWSFIHIEDAATATVAAIERDAEGIFNITDDEPASVSEWLPALAEAIGAPRPMRVPRFLARLAVGEPGIVLMTDIRGASNAKAKRELRWHPKWSTWRDGFRQQGLGAGIADVQHALR